MNKVYLLEPRESAVWFPFYHCRPVAELRAGIWLIRERWEAVAQGETEAIFGPPHLQYFSEEGVPPVRPWGPVVGPAVVGRSEFAPSGEAMEFGSDPARLVNEGETVGWWIPEGIQWEGDHSDWPAVEIGGILLRGAYDLLTALDHLLAPDAADFTQEPGDPIPDGCVVIGDPADVVLMGAAVEPGVVFDVRHGAVVLDRRSYVRSGTRLEGPLYVGPATQVLGDAIAFSSVGPFCKIRGEISHSVFLGYSNKAHYGFIGHSVIGRWVNLGAGTTNSNLKNTYGSVRLAVGSERIETGMQFLGSLIGDHVKTAIGVQLDTGTVIGAGANVFGPARPPKYVAPFAWGLGGEAVALEGFLKVAERVMARRGVAFTEEIRRMLADIHQYATGTVAPVQL
jgi:UDP-N-acetylglucosamine diphosphorylase/glucosamine-1-phosphate N-acetyltransferase